MAFLPLGACSFFERVSRLHSAVQGSYPVDAANGSPRRAEHLRPKKGAMPQSQGWKPDRPQMADIGGLASGGTGRITVKSGFDEPGGVEANLFNVCR
jgi:hypothetical protein